jgi:hypothetical protein
LFLKKSKNLREILFTIRMNENNTEKEEMGGAKTPDREQYYQNKKINRRRSARTRTRTRTTNMK